MNTTANATIMMGTIKWFSSEKGYGFIVGDDGLDYFLHEFELADPQQDVMHLAQNVRVAYQAQKNSKGLKAVEIGILRRIDIATALPKVSNAAKVKKVVNDDYEAALKKWVIVGLVVIVLCGGVLIAAKMVQGIHPLLGSMVGVVGIPFVLSFVFMALGWTSDEPEAVEDEEDSFPYLGEKVQGVGYNGKWTVGYKDCNGTYHWYE